jgi:hypothetical protein
LQVSVSTIGRILASLVKRGVVQSVFSLRMGLTSCAKKAQTHLCEAIAEGHKTQETR